MARRLLEPGCGSAPARAGRRRSAGRQTRQRSWCRVYDQVTGLRTGDRKLDGLEVAYLTDQDNVRVLTQRGRRALKPGTLPSSRWLITDLLCSCSTDGVLDGNDVLGALVIDLVDHRGQGGGLTATGRPGDRIRRARSAMTGGRLSSSMVGMRRGIRRKAPATVPRSR